MAINRANGLPSPPHDLAKRGLPLQRISGTIYRIHRTVREPFHFGRNKTQRFDDSQGRYGVLYATLQPEGAFAEVFLRPLSSLAIPETYLEERSLCQIRCKALKCVDLSAAGLRKVSCDNRISTEKPYSTARLWSRAFFEHPDAPHGIIYRSRHNPRFKCLALFDRCASKLGAGHTEPLMEGARRHWTIAQVTRYNLALEPVL